MSLPTKLGVSAVIVSALALTACSASGGSAPANEGAVEINVLGYAALFEDQYTAAVVDKFNAAQDEIVVNFVPSQNSAEMLGKLRSEAKTPTVDVAILDASVAHTGNREGLFAKITEAEVPNLANVVELGKNAEGYGPAVTFDNLVVLYNEAGVPTPPKGIADLWNAPENSVSIPAPPDIQGHTLTILTANSLGKDYRDGIEPAIEKLSELAPLVNTWEPVPDVYQPVISGTSLYGIGWNARAQYFADDSDGAMKVVQPDDGIGFQINTINLVEGTEKANAANEFIDYALSKEAQESFAEALFYAPVVSNAEVPESLEGRVADSEDPNIVDIDWIGLADVRDSWTEQWRRSVIGG